MKIFLKRNAVDSILVAGALTAFWTHPAYAPIDGDLPTGTAGGLSVVAVVGAIAAARLWRRKK